ncbi:HEAT repeat domain-containing protein, partial [Azonexus sp. R2A61]|uniref:HEAT repeat domain-containing protein n=1 Tax=Azonexus sp. R2A61 TaxID=2744443 RepID=UPI001F20F2ED
MSDIDLPDEILAVQPLLAADDATVRRVALLQIADFADEYPVPFVAASRDPDAGVRLEAARALEATADGEAVAALGALLTDADPEVAAAAAVSLGEILDPAAAPALLDLLAVADGAARVPVLAGLRRLRAPAALAPALGL